MIPKSLEINTFISSILQNRKTGSWKLSILPWDKWVAGLVPSSLTPEPCMWPLHYAAPPRDPIPERNNWKAA